jgi:hypothetical protein
MKMKAKELHYSLPATVHMLKRDPRYMDSSTTKS